MSRKEPTNYLVEKEEKKIPFWGKTSIKNEDRTSNEKNLKSDVTHPPGNHRGKRPDGG